MILSLDPGINGCGVALFHHQNVHRAFYAKPSWAGRTVQDRVVSMSMGVMRGLRLEEHAAIGRADSTIVVEWMQAYDRGGKRVDPNVSLFPLIAVAAAVCTLFPFAQHTGYKPHDWKGSLDGDAMVGRIKEQLSQEELNRLELPAPSLTHNVFDAVGIGLKFVGRLERVRVFPR